ncbi:hypothetical protein Hanom_Chr06g00524451 [Helianthus anomalus]
MLGYKSIQKLISSSPSQFHLSPIEILCIRKQIQPKPKPKPNTHTNTTHTDMWCRCITKQHPTK